MTAATVTPLRSAAATRLVALPVLPRARRKARLEALAERQVLGVPLEDDEALALAAWLSGSQLTAAHAAPRWAGYLSEYRRWLDVEAGEPDFRDCCPETCRADMAAALSDLLDGTTTYHGDRSGDRK